MAEHYRSEIRTGRMGPDEKLPTNRDMAEEWSISTHTVWRAMGILKAEGWIDYSQGRRPVVVGDPGAQGGLQPRG